MAMPANHPRRTAAVADVLDAIVERSGGADRIPWLDGAPLAGNRTDRVVQEVLTAFAGAGRRYRNIPPVCTSDDIALLARLGAVGAHTWSLDRFVRTLLLERAVRALGERAPAFLEHAYRTGDNGERIALLGALPLLEAPERFAPTAADACRTNVVIVFEAIACENAYPADQFDDPTFNQMVMKAMFQGIALDRVVGWPRRVNADLQRMAGDYASERRAAGRPVPDDVVRILELHGGPGEVV